MMRVLFIIEGLDRGGKERQLYEITRLMSGNDDMTVGVITFNMGGHYSKLLKECVDFYREIPKRPLKIQPFYKILGPIKLFNPDIIHTWDSLSTMFALIPSKLLNIPIVDGSIRDSGVDRGWQYYFRRFFLKRARLIIANSQAGLRYYKVDGQVIYNAIDTGRFKKPSSRKRVVMIMVASFSDYKDQKTFLDAAALLIEEGIIHKAILAGDGKFLSHFKQYVNEFLQRASHSIEFLGAISNVEEILEECTYGVLCSTSKYGEGISNSLLEYMAAGVISLATDIGGSQEIIEDGVNGFLFSEGNSQQLFELIRNAELNSEMRASVLGKASLTISSKFSYRGNVTKIIEQYQLMISSHHG